MTAAAEAPPGPAIALSALEGFAARLLAANGVVAAQAEAVARNAVWNEAVGRPNFGVLRFAVYLQRLAAGGLNAAAAPRVEQRSGAVALIDGDGGFGQYAGELAIRETIAQARDSGVAIAAVHNSNFFGSGAYFVEQAAAAGMIALAMSNSFPKVVAHGGLMPVFGTNPFAFGAPRGNGEHLLIDMATSALAGSTVRQHLASGEPLPEGLAIDGEGRPITDPAIVSDGALLPAGGAKGYCLALLVEVLAGVLSGAGVSHGVRSMYADLAESGDNGHFMLAIDIARFMPLQQFHQRLEDLAATIKGSHPGHEVLLPGEIRWQKYRASLVQGVRLAPSTLVALDPLARRAGIEVPWPAPAEAM